MGKCGFDEQKSDQAEYKEGNLACDRDAHSYPGLC